MNNSLGIYPDCVVVHLNDKVIIAASLIEITDQLSLLDLRLLNSV